MCAIFRPHPACRFDLTENHRDLVSFHPLERVLSCRLPAAHDALSCIPAACPGYDNAAALRFAVALVIDHDPVRSSLAEAEFTQITRRAVRVGAPEVVIECRVHDGAGTPRFSRSREKGQSSSHATR